MEPQTMATTPGTASGNGDVVLPVAADDDVAGGEADSSELQDKKSERRREVVRRKLKRLNNIVFCVALLEWAGNAVGTLAFLWATVILLGGFSSLLNRMDFWIATIMIFQEGFRVFIRNDASVNQWLFGSTSAFRWEYLSSPHISGLSECWSIIAVIIGVGVALTPLEFLLPDEIAVVILKVALLVIISQLLTRQSRPPWVANTVLLLFLVPAICGGFYGFIKIASHTMKRSKGVRSKLKLVGFYIAWVAGTHLVAKLLTCLVCISIHLSGMLQLFIKAVIALGLACLPFLQATKLVSHYRYASISVAVVLLRVSNYETRKRDESLDSESSDNICLLLEILDTILPILFIWSVMFPLPGISLEMSFVMLISVMAAVVIANLQIPVAFLQVLLSIMRLGSLLGHHHHDYRPLPPDASPNLVPSIVIFFVMELCQGSSYILAVILGLISFFRRRSLARCLKFEQEWGEKAVNLYFRQAYQARTEKGLFLRSEKDKNYMPSLESFAIQSLGCTSSHEMQIVGLRILDKRLKEGDSKSNKKLITVIVKDAKNIITNIIELMCYLTDEESSGDDTRKKHSTNNDQEKEWRSFSIHRTDDEDSDDTQPAMADSRKKRQMEVVHLSLEFVRRLAINGGKISAVFRKELWENPFFLDSLDHVLNLEASGSEERQVELWKPVMDIIATLALDEAARKEIGSSQAIIDKLIRSFLRQDDVNHRDKAQPHQPAPLSPPAERIRLQPSRQQPPASQPNTVKMAAGEALANLTIKSTYNCWAILLADPEHDLIKKLIDMLKDDNYICVAANLLHNVCANCREGLIDLGASVHLESALPDVMEFIRTKEGKQLEAALCVASQIGYPKFFAQMLESDTDAATALVERLVNILKSKKPSLEYPRIRRVLVEEVISIVELCPAYIEIFREKGALDALDMIKGTPSRLEKYRAFLDGEGVVEESLPMHDLVKKAKGLIDQTTPTPGA